MIGRNIKQKTKQRYDSMMNNLATFIEKNFPDVFEDGELPCPLPVGPTSAFFGALAKPGNDLDKLTGPEQLPEKYDVPLSLSQLRGHRPAIKKFYESKGINKIEPEELSMDIDKQIIGYDFHWCSLLLTIYTYYSPAPCSPYRYAKCINSLKRKGLYSTTEGRRPLLMSGLRCLAMAFLTFVPRAVGQDSWSTYVFAWGFLVVMWSLMSRSDSVDNLTLHHIEWAEDCMLIEEQGGKCDQTGDKKFKKHVYANPYEPSICPILAIAVNLFIRPSGGTMQLFIGTDSKGRFCSLLHTVLDLLTAMQRALLGCEVDDIGAHSTRKGSSSYSLGQVGGPNAPTVFLRMNHTMGNVRDRYIFQCDGGDQLCGRMVVGLPFDSIEFAVLPPHFNNAASALLTDDFWTGILPDYMAYPTGVKAALPFLLASLLYHEDFLRETLPEGHLLFNMPVFAQNPILTDLSDNILLGVGRCKESQLAATGIPPHLAIANQVHDVMEELREVRIENQALRAKVENMEVVLLQKLPRAVGDYIRSNFQVEGDAVNVRDLDIRDGEMRTFIMGEIAKVLKSNQDVQVALAQQVAAAERHVGRAEAQDNSSWWMVWGDDGFGSGVYTPPNWRFPVGLPAKTMWSLWLFGNMGTTVRPYRLLRRPIDITKADHCRHTRAKKLMEFLVQYATEHCLPEGVQHVLQLSVVQSFEVFDRMYGMLHDDNFFSDADNRPLSVRALETTYGTMYNNYTTYCVRKGWRAKRQHKDKGARE